MEFLTNGVQVVNPKKDILFRGVKST